MADRRYCAYLLRCWQGNEGEMLGWRASLEDPHTGERIGFATFDAAIAFLRERLHTINERPEDHHLSCQQADDEELHNRV